MNKLFLSILTLLITNISFAQQKNTNESNSSQFTQEQIYKMNQQLSDLNYEEFYKTILDTKVSGEPYLNYLLSKKDEGHAPTYWLLADYYSKNNSPRETHKWYYIASIYTQQESYLCKDETAKNAPRILVKQFNGPQELITRTPQYIEPSMREVSFFLSNLHNRPNPKWVCNFGIDPVKPNEELTIPKANWNNERQKVLKRFTDKFDQ